MSARKLLYFGHPVNTYHTPLELTLLEKIAHAFPGWEVENPNRERHQEGYRHFAETRGNGMAYFLEKVLPACGMGVFLPFRDGRWGAGVHKEAEILARRNCPVWQITAKGILTRVTAAEITPLSVEETRARIRDAKGKPLPY